MKLVKVSCRVRSYLALSSFDQHSTVIHKLNTIALTISNPRIGILQLVKVGARLVDHVVHIHQDVIVTVSRRLLMPKSQGVQQLMHHSALQPGGYIRTNIQIAVGDSR
jgi:hypothetical protein